MQSAGIPLSPWSPAYYNSQVQSPQVPSFLGGGWYQYRQSGRYYETGMDVSDEAPHIVKTAGPLRGVDGRNIAASQMPSDGDELVAVDDRDVTDVQSLKGVPHIMLGLEGSQCKLTFRARASKEVFHIWVQRVVPSKIWCLYQMACKYESTYLQTTGWSPIKAEEVLEDLYELLNHMVNQGEKLNIASSKVLHLTKDLEEAKRAMGDQTIPYGVLKVNHEILKQNYDNLKQANTKLQSDVSRLQKSLTAVNFHRTAAVPEARDIVLVDTWGEELPESIEMSKGFQELIEKHKDLQEKYNILLRENETYDAEVLHLRKMVDTYGYPDKSVWDRMRADNERLAKEVAELKETWGKCVKIDSYCKRGPHNQVTPDDLVKGFDDANLRADDVLRLCNILQMRPPPVVDEVELIFKLMRESDKSFVALVEDLTKIVDLTRQCEVAEEGRCTANYLHDKERAMRMKFEDEAAECRRLVDTCSGALDEWVPMMEALRRAPPVAPHEMARAISNSISTPRDLITLFSTMNHHQVAAVPDLVGMIEILYSNEDQTMESTQSLMCKISSIQAQRWQFQHLDPNSKAGKMAASRITRGVPPLLQDPERDKEYAEEVKRLTATVQREDARSISSYLTSPEGKARIAEVMSFQDEYEKERELHKQRNSRTSSNASRR